MVRCAHSGGPAATGGIYSSAAAPRAAMCVFCICAIGQARARLAAGVTWTSRTTSAPWAARCWHTSVIDAAGAIYVIGGYGGRDSTTHFNDVWVSADGGARPDIVKGVVGGCLGVLRRYSGVLGYNGLLSDSTQGNYRGTTKVLEGSYGGLEGYLGGTLGGTIRAFPWPSGDLRYL
jgi:hypothetical protein